ncbi:LLM class F420-dependent oxidoreductase [Flexivirga caeni]|uniref:LLM class F420-dependent oxidoreductase n=1 Tax=Flexivirga caeni TaxID=2294115 RepID=A0A3M9M1C7_9MICO|nr:LLM class F420-dependent oxidoreductase [Flexivirga caeni]RNI18318.1 LLM class F420-dependent oxidoreductase [Flexivirga caeni]
MELRIFTEPQQGASYDDLVAVAQHAERLGFGAFFRSDHYLAMGSASGLPGPSDAWITLAGIARETSTIRLGTLVTSATFRLPGVLAIEVANVDAMSGGRVELGLGAGWFDQEHAAYGIPFPATGERFDRLEEQLEIVTGLWSADGSYSFDGTHYQLTDSPALPKPVQRNGIRGGVPVIIGGHGKKRTPALAAAYADEFNVAFSSVTDTCAQIGRVQAAVESAGRAADSIVYSAAQVLCTGSDEAQLARRAAAIGREVGELRENGAAGTPIEVVDRLGELAEAGVERVYLQLLDLNDLEHLDLVASEVMPHVAR